MDTMIQLYYFRSRGRAEVIRIMLNYLQLDYQDIFIDTNTAMEALRTQRLSPFKQIPILYIDDQYLVQTPAILRYLARQYHLYGNNNAEKYRCDMLTAAAFDWQTSFFKAIFNTSATANYAATLLNKHLTIFEAILKSHNKIYFVNQQPTFADLLIFEILLNQDDMFSGILQTYPKLQAFTETLNNIPPLHAYLSSKKRMPLPAKGSAYHQTIAQILGRK